MLAPRRLASPPGVGPRGWRRTAHGLAIVAGWLLFFWGWYRVLATAPDFAELRLLMLGAAIVVPVVTVSWILHNRGIHRRKGPRRSVPAATLAYGVDFNGREIVADFRALAHAQRVDVVVDGACKHYRAQDRQEDPGGAVRASTLHAIGAPAAAATRAGQPPMTEGAGARRAVAQAGADETPQSIDREPPPRP